MTVNTVRQRERVHVLKTLPRYWRALFDGHKTFEVRRDDRAFAEGDLLILRYYEPGPRRAWCSQPELDCDGVYHQHDQTDIVREVSYVLPGGQFGIEVGYVVLGLQPVGDDRNVPPVTDEGGE